VILGADFLTKTGMDVKYSTHTIEWFDNEIPLRDPYSLTNGDTLVFLGGKTCCAFDCAPNVDTAIEDKIKDRQKATLQAMRVIHACRKESLFFLQTNWAMS